MDANASAIPCVAWLCSLLAGIKGDSWMAAKMIHDALKELAEADKIDTGIPDIHARTIQFLIYRKTCLCGAAIEFGNREYTELNKLLDYIPPKSIGTLIGQFVRECELKSNGAADAFDDISGKFRETLIKAFPAPDLRRKAAYSKRSFASFGKYRAHPPEALRKY